MKNVSQLSGTSGRRNTGSVDGNLPMSPTVRTSHPAATVTTLNRTMQTSGDGTALVTRGSR